MRIKISNVTIMAADVYKADYKPVVARCKPMGMGVVSIIINVSSLYDARQ